MPRILTFPVAALVISILLLAGCRTSTQPGEQASTPVASQVSGVESRSTSTPTAIPTATVSPTPTATPTATPTPVAAAATGALPVGQVIFSTARIGEASQQLWRLPAGGELARLSDSVAAGDWDCAGSQPACAFIGSQGEVMALAPVTMAMTLLDQLPGLPAAPAAITATHRLTGSAPITASTFSLSDDGAVLAIALPTEVRLYDLAARQPLASVAVTDTAQLAWSPDSSRLGLVYRTANEVTLALWRRDSDAMRTLARMSEIGHVAWSPDGKKLAFDARTEAATPSSQGGQSDVYVLTLDSGEVRNLTEIFVRNNGVPVGQQVAAWAPSWEPDSKAVRYVRGVPGDPDTHRVFRHPLASRAGNPLGAASEADAAGLVSASNTGLEARAVEREGFSFVQVRDSEGDQPWRDAGAAGFRGLHSLAWAPTTTTEAVDDQTPSTSASILLMAADQGLLLLDVSTGSIVQLVAACADCSITRAEWLP